MNRTNTCKIERGKIWLDDALVFSSEKENFDDFSKEAYRFLKISYVKFFKMDRLSKLAFLAAEMALAKNPGKNTALVLSNKSSSLDTDYQYFKSIENSENYFPTPAVFVYTLPNICLGEISIRHQLHTENAFFIGEDADAAELYAAQLINSGKAENALVGNVEIYRENYSAFVYLLK